MEQTAADSSSINVEKIYPALLEDWSPTEIYSAVSSLDKKDGKMPSECDVEAYLLAKSLGLQPSLVMTRND